MKITVPNIFDLSSSWDKAKSQLGEELLKFSDSITAGWGKQHGPDGTHTDITATSVNLQDAPVGELVDLSYDTSRFFSDGTSVWGVGSEDMLFLRASRVGQLVFIQFNLYATSLGTDESAFLGIRLPEFHAKPEINPLLAPEAQVGGTLRFQDSSGSDVGAAYVRAENFGGTIPSTTLYLVKGGITETWKVGTIYLRGSCWFACEPNNIGKPFFGS